MFVVSGYIILCGDIIALPYRLFETFAYFVYVWVLSVCMYVNHVHDWCVQSSEKGIGSLVLALWLSLNHLCQSYTFFYLLSHLSSSCHRTFLKERGLCVGEKEVRLVPLVFQSYLYYVLCLLLSLSPNHWQEVM